MCNQYLHKFEECISVLSVGDLWEQERDRHNSIGGIVLHICEHVSRNTSRYVDPALQFPSGIEDYFPSARLTSDELRAALSEEIIKWKIVMTGLLNNEVSKIDLHSTYHLIEHTSYHLGQVVDRTQTKTGHAFQFVQNGVNERSLRASIEQAYRQSHL